MANETPSEAELTVDDTRDEIVWELLEDEMDSVQAYVHAVNGMNGWFEDGRTFGDEIALLHSEVSEALDEFRSHGLARYFYPLGNKDAEPRVVLNMYSYPEGEKPLGVASEAADVLIRLLDFCWRYDINLIQEVKAKMAYNETRGYRHGGKAL